jgi:hypothetical protein
LVAPNITASNNVTAGNTVSGLIGVFNNKLSVLNNAYIGSASQFEVGAKFLRFLVTQTPLLSLFIILQALLDY